MKNLTPLHYAVDSNSVDIAEILIEKGVDINAKTDRQEFLWMKNGGERTPLHYAARKNNSTKMIELLISKGADIEARDIFYQIKLLFFQLL